MSADRLLTTVLQAYRSVHDPDQTNRIISTTTSLLTTLSNPLNVTLITSQLLIAPAIWSKDDGLRTCLRIISIFNNAAITVHRNQLDTEQTIPSGGIRCDKWATAVIKGADERSPRWRHTLVIAGVLLGMEGQERGGLSRGLRLKLEEAMVVAANHALENPTKDGFLGAESVVLALNHTFGLLSDNVRIGLNYDVLAPRILRAMITNEGYENGYFLGSIDSDVKQVTASKFDWSAKSKTFVNLQKMASKPLISSMGPLSKILAHAIENVVDSNLVIAILDDLLSFTATLPEQWRRNKLSEIDISEEHIFLTPDSLRVTIPVLWQVLKTAMFATVVILCSIIGRTLVDPGLATRQRIPSIAISALHILRNIYFISSRLGSNAFSTYTFVTLASTDILSHSSPDSAAFLESIRRTLSARSESGSIPAHPLDRTHDLYFLNLAENLAPILSPNFAKGIIYPVIRPYLSPTASPSLLEIFEAAHSAMLAILSSPQNADIAKEMLAEYVEALFASFPRNLSSRQFRFAFKTLIGIVTPPSRLAASEEGFVETLLEVVRYRALNASTMSVLNPPTPSQSTTQDKVSTKPLSEQAVLMLTLIDALPSLPLPILEEWLPLSADLLNQIRDPGMKKVCRERFWGVLCGGEMDVERGVVCLTWWTTGGGREWVLYGGEEDGGGGGGGSGEEYLMSGGLGGDGLRRGSRL